MLRYLQILSIALALALPSAAFAAQQYSQADFSTIIGSNPGSSNAMFQATASSKLTTVGQYLAKHTSGSGTIGFLVAACGAGSGPNTCTATSTGSTTNVNATITATPGWLSFDFTSQNYSLVAGEWYRVQYFLAPSGGADFYGVSLPDTQQAAGSYTGSDAMYVCDLRAGSCPVTDFSTHVETTLPNSGDTVATTTTTGATIYVAPADYTDGMTLTVHFVNQTANTSLSYSAADAWDRATGTGLISYVFPITSSGESTFATSTTFATGGLNFGTYTITTPSLLSGLPFIGGYFNPSTKASTSTTFTVGALTELDKAIAINQTAVASYSIYGVNATNTPVELYCNPLSTSPGATFSIVSCAGVLIVPSSGDMVNVWNQLYAQVLQRAPWGYLTRFVTIISNNAATSLPLISIETPLGRPGSPEYTDGHFTLDTNDMLAGGAVLLNTVHTSFGGDYSVQQVFEPFVDLTIALSVMMFIIHDLLGMANHKRRRAHALH